MSQTDSKLGQEIELPAPDSSQLELVRWLIDRSDRLRDSYGRRAGMVISSDAFIMAAVIFILNQSPSPRPLFSFTNISLAITLSFMYVSLVFAFSATITFKQSSGQDIKEGLLRRDFFNPHQTLKDGNARAFWKNFEKQKDKLLLYAYEELWACYLLQRKRYLRLKWSIIYLLLAVSILLISLIVGFLV